jgi:hypothetical protein
MKNFKSFEINEEVSLEKFDILVRAGLANKAQLQRLHTILQKMHEKDDVILSRADRMIVTNLFNKMLELITTDKTIFQKTRQSVREESENVENLQEVRNSKDELKSLPAILILKRKAIRLFPEGVKVAIYYSDKLNRSFTLPMMDLTMGKISEQAENPNFKSSGGVISNLRNILKDHNAGEVQFKDGKKMRIDAFSASAILQVYDRVNDVNKKKIDDLVNRDKHGLIKILDFAFSKAKK